MNNRKNSLILLFLFVASLSQAQIKLSFNPTKDLRYSYLYKTEQTSHIEALDRKMEIQIDMYVVYDIIMKEKSKDDFVIESEYKDIGVSMKSDIVNLQYDSKKAETDTTKYGKLLGSLLGAMLHKPFCVHLSEEGSVSSVSGLDAILESISKTFDNSEELNGLVKELLNEESIKNIFEQSFKIYPSTLVRVGDDWDVDMNFTAFGMNTIMKNNYTLRSVEKKAAKLDLTSAFQMTTGKGMNLSGSQNGVTELDVKTGMPVSADMTQQMVGTQLVEGNNMKLSTDSKITVRLIKE